MVKVPTINSLSLSLSLSLYSINMTNFLARITFAFLLFLSPISSQSQAQNGLNFTFNGFKQKENLLANFGATIIKSSGALRLTNRSKSAIGHSFYNKPINMLNGSARVSSFSTHFVFAIMSPSSGQGGYGLAFAIAPTTTLPEAHAEHYLGLFNTSNDGNKTNRIFAVEFDTVNGFNENTDTNGNHVGINVNGMSSRSSRPAGFQEDGSETNEEDLDLESGDPIQAWIDYDGLTGIVNVTVAPFSASKKPGKPLLSHKQNLSDVFLSQMYIGFSSSTGEKKMSSHYILGWSFAIGQEAPALNLSQLPIPQKEKSSSSFRISTKVLIGCLSGVIVALLLILSFLTLYKRVMAFETLEDWELDCPHRFRYKDLHVATKGFKDSEVIGVGGFGAVYRGILPSTGCQVAVKKITRSCEEGMREFAAEIESLGRLRHKNLVNLQGWCKNKNNLLIVYDYIPFGSLDTLIFNPKNGFVLGWENRFNILKGVASGLLYLHEEWEQVVIHRDVKSNNVLIDEQMSARLGDFGLARLHDHGDMSRTTGVVGTIGYIAPELARFGKASTSTDVFAFGALLLEVATGKRPIGPGNFVLVDWVMECYHGGRLLEVTDPNLRSEFSVKEMELVLKLGLICSHYKPEARPGMRQVIRFMNGEEEIPEIDHWALFDSQRVNQLNARFMEGISSDKVTSYRSMSLGALSYSSLDAGR